MLSYVLPTRNRPDRLRRTLCAIEALGPHPTGAEVIIVDNASDEFPILPRVLTNGLPVHVLRRPTNEGAAARNAGVQASDTSSTWIIMLDDDSYPLNIDFVHALRAAAPDVAAISGDIFLNPPSQAQARHEPTWDDSLTVELLPPHLHNTSSHLVESLHGRDAKCFPAHAEPSTTHRTVRESGGLPEVFIGCGVAIRRDAFLAAGGYDPTFNYYVEEYDLAARLLLAGHRIAFEPELQIHHAKDSAHRDFNQIVARLVRNNSWIAQRYAPEHERLPMLRETRDRYYAIAVAEDSVDGYTRGLAELRATLRRQVRSPMCQHLFDRFTGLAAARESLQSAYTQSPFHSAHLCDIGKNAHVVARALAELGVPITSDDQEAEVQVIATMSPGPMLDALAKRRAMRRPHSIRTIAPWSLPLLYSNAAMRAKAVAA